MDRENKIFLVDDAQNTQRLDRALALLCPDISRVRWQAMIDNQQVSLDDRIVTDAATRVRTGQIIQVTLLPPVAAEPVPVAMDLNIVHEDEDLLVIDKPAGMVVHPGAGHQDETLVHGLLAHCGDSLSGIGGVARPGIVHRLDKDTSGLIVIAKHDAAHQALSAQFADRSLSRIYQALVWGRPMPHTGRVDTLIGRDKQNRQKMAVVTHNGKQAVTDYRVLASSPHLVGNRVPVASLMECRLHTGRTHQIRVHMSHIGHPILGDPTYGQTARRSPYAKIGAVPVDLSRQALHAAFLYFVHPRLDTEMMFASPLPDDMIAAMAELGIGVPSDQ